MIKSLYHSTWSSISYVDIDKSYKKRKVEFHHYSFSFLVYILEWNYWGKNNKLYILEMVV